MYQENLIQSGLNEGVIAIDTVAIAVSLVNGSNGDLDLLNLYLRYDDSVVGLRNQKFTITSTANKQNLINLGEMFIGSFGMPVDKQPNIFQVKKKLVVPKGDGVTLNIIKPTINIPARSIFLFLEYGKNKIQ
jgi:hypothetical protein